MALFRITRTGAAPPTGLAGGVSAAATNFSLTNASGYPTGTGGPFVLVLDPGTPLEEKVLCSSLSGVVVTVAPSGRGWDGTSAAAHSAGAGNVAHVFASAEADDANAHIYDTTRNDHTQYALASAGGPRGYVTQQSTSGITVPCNGTFTAMFAPTFTLAANRVYRISVSAYGHMSAGPAGMCQMTLSISTGDQRQIALNKLAPGDGTFPQFLMGYAALALSTSNTQVTTSVNFLGQGGGSFVADGIYIDIEDIGG